MKHGMYIFDRTDKRSGVIYVYSCSSFWNKEKKRSENKQILLGIRDPETGEILPTRSGRKRSKPVSESAVPEYRQLYCGATHLLDEIGRITGVEKDLRQCFPESYKEILSLAYYMIMESESVVSRFHRWSRNHRHPCGHDLSSQRISELFAAITHDEVIRFCRMQAKRREDKEYWAVDTTSVSSYSNELHQVRRGHNKDGESMDQLNLAILYGQQSRLPFYYRRLAGNIPDSKVLKELTEALQSFECPRAKLILDRGFYSEANINSLFEHRIRFLVGLPKHLVLVKSFIEEVLPVRDAFDQYDPCHEVFSFVKRIKWQWKRKRPYKGDTLREERRAYLFLYYNVQTEADERLQYSRHLRQLQKELIDGPQDASHTDDYAKYFTVRETPKRGRRVTANQEAMDALRRTYGFFALLSNDIRDPSEALTIYRLRNVVESAFWDLKQRLDMNRTRVSSDASMDGKLFVQFIALIYLSFLKQKMTETELFSHYTMNGLLDELDDIVVYLTPGKQPVYGAVLKAQADLYKKLGVDGIK